MITKVAPNASTPLTAVASKMPIKLSKVRKYGEAIEKPINMAIRALKAITRCIASERNKFLELFVDVVIIISRGLRLVRYALASIFHTGVFSCHAVSHGGEFHNTLL